jgi:hypothetical protein
LETESFSVTGKKVFRFDIAALICKETYNAICEIIIRIAKGGNHGIIHRSDDTGSKTGC